MKRLVVLGAGESGAGAAVLAKKQGLDVFVSDFGEIKNQYKQVLDNYEIPWEEKQHTEKLILNADEVVKSPGIPEKASIVKALLEKGTPVISEIEFAGRYTHAKMICITGSTMTLYFEKSLPFGSAKTLILFLFASFIISCVNSFVKTPFL